MTYYAVIDTNVIVSSMLKTNSIPGLIVKLIYKDIIVPLVNKEIIEEYFDVLTRNKFGIPKQIIKRELTLIKEKKQLFGKNQNS